MSDISIRKATLYKKYRLPYAPQLIDEFLAQIGPIETVADIGSGTGQLARLFANQVNQIYAIEPEVSWQGHHVRF